MLVHFGVDLIEAEWSGSTVCIGMFDGVHLGHQELIRQTVALAAEQEHPSIIVTFDRNPLAILAPDRKPASIGTLELNVRACRGMGASLGVIMRFDQELSQTSASEFLDEVLVKSLKAKHIVVGHDFALGRGREGTGEWLSERIPTTIVGAVEHKGIRVSSSHIRELIAAGEVSTASEFLTRPFRMAGIVVSGQKLGRTIGYPTINLARASDQIIPLDGIYAGLARTPHGTYKAAISIGFRPTVDGSHRTIEAYLLDYPGTSLYGAPVEISFIERIRGEEKFDGLEALTKAIDRDVEMTRSLVSL